MKVESRKSVTYLVEGKRVQNDSTVMSTDAGSTVKVTVVVGGRWHAFDLARELNRQGHLHKLITSYPRWSIEKWGIPKDKVVSVPLVFIAVKLIYMVGGEHMMMRLQWIIHGWFANRAKKHLEGSELIHGWSSWSLPSMIWAKDNRIPFVLERSSAHILEQSRILREQHKRYSLRWACTHPEIEKMELCEYELATQVAVPSSFVEESFLRRGYERDRLKKSMFGVSLELFSPGNGSSPPTKNSFRVIYAGALSIQKGIPDLLQAFEIAQIPGSELLLLGGITKELRSFLKRQPSSVRAVGHRPQKELPAFYQTAHCFVMPSTQEGMAMVQLQALACGLPLICTTNSGGEDVLQLSGDVVCKEVDGIAEYNAGFVVPINRPDAIAACLRRLADNPMLWQEKRKAATLIAKRDLSWQQYAERAIANYERLILDQKRD